MSRENNISPKSFFIKKYYNAKVYVKKWSFFIEGTLSSVCSFLETVIKKPLNMSFDKQKISCSVYLFLKFR